MALEQITAGPAIELADASQLVSAPVISVYMLTYRHAPYLAQAIESVLAQQVGVPFELIIGEDCSPDGSLDICREYLARRPDVVRILTAERNVGAKANAARCQAAARGRFIAICEGDDYWTDRSKLARQLDVFRVNPECALVFHAAELVDATTGRRTGVSRWSRRSRRFTREELVLGDGGMVPTASILVRKDVFPARPPWALDAPVGDYPLVLAAALQGSVIYLDRCMSVYRTAVPHSWTQRQAPFLDNRMRYAMGIERMLHGFADDAPECRSAVDRVVSKYYSDAIVRSKSGRRQRVEAYRQVSDRLSAVDGCFAWMACFAGIRMPWLKTLARKFATALRLLAARLRQDGDVRVGNVVHGEDAGERIS